MKGALNQNNLKINHFLSGSFLQILSIECYFEIIKLLSKNERNLKSLKNNGPINKTKTKENQKYLSYKTTVLVLSVLWD